MIRRPARLVALLVALAAATARTDPYTNAFDAFRTALTARIAELPESPTPPEAKERAVLDKIAAALAAPSAGLAGDVRTAVRIARLLKKKAVRGTPLASQLAAVADSLCDELGALIHALRDRLQAIPSSVLRAKASAALDRAGRTLDAASGRADVGRRVGGMLRGAIGLAGAEKRVAKAEVASGVTPCVPGPRVMAATLDSTPWTAQETTGSLTVDPVGKVLYVIVDGYGGASRFVDKLELALSAAFHGTGTYPVFTNDTDLRFTQPDSAMFIAISGTITITEFDAATGHVKGSFDVGAGAYPLPVTEVHRYAGTFEVTCAKVTHL